MKLPVQAGRPARWGRERLSAIGVAAASGAAWLLAVCGLISTVGALPALGPARAGWVAALCAGTPLAGWLTRRAVSDRRIRAAVPPEVLEQRIHGRLDVVIDTDRRALRSVAVSAYDTAARTGDLLAELFALPGVRVFRGVRAGAAGSPVIPHAISAGRQVIFIESVAWPPGHYDIRENGLIHCDGTYIGQSVRPLVAVVRRWQRILPRRHRVSALVVVHAAAPGDIALPDATPDGLAWVHADRVIPVIRRRMARGRPVVSMRLVAALIAASADGP